MLPALQMINESPLDSRRFGTADLSKHGGWIMKRLLKAFPHQNERSLAGWLRETINSNTSLFLYQLHGVALFQVVSANSLEHKPMIYERFVFAEEGHEKDAAHFYSDVEIWAKGMGIEQIVVEVMSDIPHDTIKEKLGRLYTRQTVFARV